MRFPDQVHRQLNGAFQPVHHAADQCIRSHRLVITRGTPPLRKNSTGLAANRHQVGLNETGARIDRRVTSDDVAQQYGCQILVRSVRLRAIALWLAAHAPQIADNQTVRKAVAVFHIMYGDDGHAVFITRFWRRADGRGREDDCRSASGIGQHICLRQTAFANQAKPYFATFHESSTATVLDLQCQVT